MTNDVQRALTSLKNEIMELKNVIKEIESKFNTEVIDMKCNAKCDVKYDFEDKDFSPIPGLVCVDVAEED